VGRRHHPDDTPYEGALGFAVKLDHDFIGRDALEGAAEPARRLCCVELADPRSVALGNEPARAGGEICGRVTSGGYGYTVGASIAYAYLPAEHAAPGTEVAVEVFGEWIDGAVRPSRSSIQKAHECAARVSSKCLPQIPRPSSRRPSTTSRPRCPRSPSSVS
jgi:glycine cleavage system aminomethyltransferase T